MSRSWVIQLDYAKSAAALRSLTDLEANTKHGARVGLRTLGARLRKEVHDKVLFERKRGRIYRIGNITHVASAPGQTPSNLSGYYRHSTRYTMASWDELTFGNSAEYAADLEFGRLPTAEAPRIAPRPGIWNAIVAQERNALRDLALSIQAAI